MTDTPAPPSAEAVARWSAAIAEMMARDGTTEAESNTNLINLLKNIADDPTAVDVFFLAQRVATVEGVVEVVEDLQSRVEKLERHEQKRGGEGQ